MASSTTSFDLILKGGTLLDPAQGINDRRDIAFQGGKIAAVAERIDPAGAASVIDVAGKVITPGLIDLHGHFYHGGSGSAVHADQNCLSAGATTGVDAGSSGFLNYGAMKDYVFPRYAVCEADETGVCTHSTGSGAQQRWFTTIFVGFLHRGAPRSLQLNYGTAARSTIKGNSGASPT